jgi:glycosyltransferase involved in cell wall biosynthesis
MRSDLSIGFVISHPFHGSPGSILRVRELSKGLSNLGVKVHIYSPYSSDENWGNNINFHKLANLSSTLKVNDISYRLSRWALNNYFFMHHIISKNMLDSAINSLAKSLTNSIDTGDLDLIQGEQEIAAIACIRARDKLGVPVVASLHNIWPEELVAMRLIQKTSAAYAFLQGLEQEIVSKSDFITVVSEEMATYLSAKSSSDSCCISVVPPGGRIRQSQVADRTLPFKVVYAGLVVSRANVELFIKSMPFILKKYPETKFYISAKGEEIKQIKRLAQNIHVRPEYYWFKKSDDFYKFLASCHVGVVTSTDDLPRRMGPAVKLFDYLSVGLPVVANNIGGWTKVIDDEQIGVLTESDPKSFADGVLKVLDNYELPQQLSKRGLELVKTKLSWDQSATALLRIYQKIISAKWKEDNKQVFLKEITLEAQI